MAQFQTDANNSTLRCESACFVVALIRACAERVLGRQLGLVDKGSVVVWARQPLNYTFTVTPLRQ